ncbi:hypothetical protein C4578_03200 [Candidatus Microgenomates bacterium]|jgi:peptidoglycan hydrolase CwlO-like protein|nr:MAG: hypothetical protein C4578_03200 [Candidatus Microgenomates bacterium]
MKQKILLILFFIFLQIFSFRIGVFAAECTTPREGATREELEDIIRACEAQIGETKKQVDSLSREIGIIDGQIRVAQLKISQTEYQIRTLEEEIVNLSGKIERLDGSLDYLSRVLLDRVAESYKRNKVDAITILFSSRNVSDFVARYRYLQKIQLHDRELLLSMEQTRTSYDEQKSLKEQKQEELEKLQAQLLTQKKQLDIQVANRKRILEETRGKEAVYQQFLASAKGELEAILGILEGKGREERIKDVSEGEKIASVIYGASCNSNGTHLHFMITKDGKPLNPFSYLKGGINYENCSGSSCGSADADPFNPQGDWGWPLNEKIRLTQGYGYTWAIQHIPWLRAIYTFHNGIDLQGGSLDVRATKKGALYWGSYVGRCTLKYVKVEHEDGFSSYYLHVNY